MVGCRVRTIRPTKDGDGDLPLGRRTRALGQSMWARKGILRDLCDFKIFFANFAALLRVLRGQKLFSCPRQSSLILSAIPASEFFSSAFPQAPYGGDFSCQAPTIALFLVTHHSSRNILPRRCPFHPSQIAFLELEPEMETVPWGPGLGHADACRTPTRGSRTGHPSGQAPPRPLSASSVLVLRALAI